MSKELPHLFRIEGHLLRVSEGERELRLSPGKDMKARFVINPQAAFYYPGAVAQELTVQRGADGQEWLFQVRGLQPHWQEPRNSPSHRSRKGVRQRVFSTGLASLLAGIGARYRDPKLSDLTSAGSAAPAI